MSIVSVKENIESVEAFLDYLRNYFECPKAKPKRTIANEAEISRMYLHSLIEGTKSDPSLSVAIRLAKAMGTSLEKILKKAAIHS